jgi:hypothetical protein
MQLCRHGELQVKYDATNHAAIVQGDIDGNGKADFQIEVHSLTALGELHIIKRVRCMSQCPPVAQSGLRVRRSRDSARFNRQASLRESPLVTAARSGGFVVWLGKYGHGADTVYRTFVEIMINALL